MYVQIFNKQSAIKRNPIFQTLLLFKLVNIEDVHKHFNLFNDYYCIINA